MQPKGRRQNIITSDFIFSYGRLNLNSLTPERREKIAQTTGLLETNVVEILKCGENNDGYWDEAKLHQQVVNKALPIAKTFYPGYSFFYLFDNVTSHSVYAKDALQVQDMNKGCEGKQPILQDGWFDNGDGCLAQSMNFLNDKNQWIQKGIQKVLEERGLWPAKGLNVSYLKPKCFNCQVVVDCKICVKGHKCDTCKAP